MRCQLRCGVACAENRSRRLRLAARLRDADWFAGLMYILGASLWLAGMFIGALAVHVDRCKGPTTGRCDWYWCRYYDGSDPAHDFTIKTTKTKTNHNK